jgi:hypothetical protein
VTFTCVRSNYWLPSHVDLRRITPNLKSSEHGSKGGSKAAKERESERVKERAKETVKE